MTRGEFIGKLSFVVCDDEQAGCEVITHLLKHNGAQTITTFNDPAIALSFLSKTRVDVAFLDITMPRLDGLELARRLHGIGTQIIFVTAHDRFAVSAFEVRALDYLTKPVAPGRFTAALERVIATSTEVKPPNLEASTYPIVLKDKGAVIPLTNLEIRTIESAGKYTVISTVTDRHVCRIALKELESQLGRDIVRVHRSKLVNIRWIKKLVFINHKWFVLTLDDERVAVGEKYRCDLRGALDHWCRDTDAAR